MLSRALSVKKGVDGHVFRSKMSKGKIRSALSYISHEQTGGVLSLDDIIPESQGLTTSDVLRDKHPIGKPACPEALLSDIPETVSPIIYGSLDAECNSMQPCIPRVLQVSLALLHMLGGDLCSSFKSVSHDLCHALAAMGQRICTSTIHPDDLSAFVACCLIPLNKCPGVRPTEQMSWCETHWNR